MELYETEEQQIKALKEWWGENGVSIIVGILLGVGGFLGFQWWTGKQAAATEAASYDYSQLIDIDATQKPDEFKAAAAKMKTEHKDSIYAVWAAAHLAKYWVDQSDFSAAQAELAWALANAKGTDIAPIIEIRLARLEIQQDNIDAAISRLATIKAEEYQAMVQRVLGDAYYAKGDLDKAREAYQAALDNDQTSGINNDLTLLVNDLAVAPEAAPAASSDAEATDEGELGNTEKASNTAEESADDSK